LKRLLSVSLFFCFSVCVHQTVIPIVCAGWDEATSAHEKGDYVTAYKEIRPLAEQGDPVVQ